ncbi:hypothetical protein TRFO_24616 [Tritrichomonas foetus]|uniref:Protein kinase domain-containing protein n=1 Tax=Tritrichomonas foetus TaxID=1144522 RepID=A0A1J4KC92_9EUKA|nr:hypothetical protein TRFO_24616 [Tritrichomonas foetus]|eukprot:OHT07278.1 hypothetical protein TRFO_24616 [Tritrichomonas foetus]
MSEILSEHLLRTSEIFPLRKFIELPFYFDLSIPTILISQNEFISENLFNYFAEAQTNFFGVYNVVHKFDKEFFIFCTKHRLFVIFLSDLDLLVDFIKQTLNEFPKIKRKILIPETIEKFDFFDETNAKQYFSSFAEDSATKIVSLFSTNLEFPETIDDQITYSGLYSLCESVVATFYFYIQCFPSYTTNISKTHQNSILLHSNNSLNKNNNCNSEMITQREFFSDEFVHIQKLGNGAKGNVFLSLHLKTGKFYSIKSFFAKKYYLREKKMYHRINNQSKSIIKYYGYIRNTNSIILSYASHGSLRTFLSTHNLTGTQKTLIIAQVLLAIDYLHCNGIIHMDIKVDNVLIDDEFNAYLCDFDASKPVYIEGTSQQQNNTHSIDSGTFLYMSPEQIKNKNISLQTDLYSLGILIYETATRESPFINLSLMNIVDKISQGEVPFLSQTEFGNITLLYQKCCSKKIENRVGSFYLINQFYLLKCYFKNTENDIIDEYIQNNVSRQIISSESASNTFSDYDQNYNLTISNELNKDSYDTNIQYNIDRSNSQGYEIVNVLNNKNNLNSMNINIANLTNRKDIQMLYCQADQYSNAIAQYYLGVILDNGFGIKRNEYLAFKFYLKSAKQNFSRAQHNAGCCYANGIGVLINKKKAFRYFKKAADSANDPVVESQIFVGKYYQKGIGVDKNETEGFKYLKKAADQHNKEALFSIGECFEKGNGVEIDCEQAFDYFLKAAQQKHQEACFKVGMIYYLRHEKEKSFNYLLESANQGFKKASLQLCQMYEKGIGTEIDLQKSIDYCCFLSEIYDAATPIMATKYEFGIGVNRNIYHSFKLFNRYINFNKGSISKCIIDLNSINQSSINKTSADQIDLSRINEKNSNRIVFINDTNKDSLSQALLHMGGFFEFGKFMQKNLALAMEYYKRSSSLNNINALIRLGVIYEFRNKDLEKAIQFYEKSYKLAQLIESSSLYQSYEIYEPKIGLYHIARLKNDLNLMKEAADLKIHAAEYEYGQYLYSKSHNNETNNNETNNTLFINRYLKNAAEVKITNAVRLINEITNCKSNYEESQKKFGHKGIYQHVYECLTCFQTNPNFLCEQCIHSCHQGHVIVDQGIFLYTSCDCEQCHAFNSIY